MVFVATRRARISDDAAERIRRLVTDRALRPGDRLPPERDLAKQLNVGRTSVREGLRTLELVGFVEVIPSKGVYLRADVAHSLDELVRDWLTTHKGTLVQLIELREPLESQAAALAARRIAPDDVIRLDQALSDMRAAIAQDDTDDVEAFVGADNRFHDAVATASRNSLLQRTLQSLAREVRTYKETTGRLGHSHRERALQDHIAVRDAIAAGDHEGAWAAMRAHIVQTPIDFGLIEDLGLSNEPSAISAQRSAKDANNEQDQRHDRRG